MDMSNPYRIMPTKRTRFMKRITQVSANLATYLLLPIALFSTSLIRVGAKAPRERKFEFEYKALVKDIPTGTKKVDLWIPVPHDSSFQRITKMTIDSPHRYKIHTTQYGNKVMHISLNNPQESSFAVTMRFNAIRKEHLQERLQQATSAPVREERDPDMDRWLQPDRLVPINGKIKQWAQEVLDAAGAKTDLEKARAIYNHIVSTVKYDKSGQGWGRGDILLRL